ncbi:MAG TPA: lysylphosphatidylglycerol synthase domain-containing protein, partial [Caldilineaceae bacterium]|nr:lysylphosphatidylglycerol synthase domain-containing protein [Caldilineaceae bacterium]
MAQPALVGLSLVLIVWLLGAQWAELRTHSWRLHGGWLALSAGLMVMAWVCEVSLWRSLLRLVEGYLSFVTAWRIWFYTALVRYVPGNVWQPLSMTLYCQQRGIRPEATLMSVALYQLLTLLSAAPLAAGYWLVAGQRAVLTRFVAGLTPWLVVLVLSPVVVALLRPGWLIAMLNWVLGKFGRPTLAMQLPASRLALGLLLGAASWLFWGGSFAALTFSLAPYSPSDWIQLTPVLVTTFAVGYAIGLLSVITPSGLGVREGAFYLLLVPLMEGSAVAGGG